MFQSLPPCWLSSCWFCISLLLSFLLAVLLLVGSHIGDSLCFIVGYLLGDYHNHCCLSSGSLYLCISLYLYIHRCVCWCLHCWLSLCTVFIFGEFLYYVCFLLGSFIFLVSYLLVGYVYIFAGSLIGSCTLIVCYIIVVSNYYCWLSSLDNFSAGWISHCWLFVFIIVVSFLVECLSDV